MGPGESIRNIFFAIFSRYNVEEQLWMMRHARKINFLATSRASETSLLLGSHLWVVHNDSLECTSEGRTSYMTNLTLHACASEQFACDNAFCIAMEKRRNAKEDCIDGSDEQNCGKLMLRQGYKKELTPIADNSQNVVVNFFSQLAWRWNIWAHRNFCSKNINHTHLVWWETYIQKPEKWIWNEDEQ